MLRPRWCLPTSPTLSRAAGAVVTSTTFVVLKTPGAAGSTFGHKLQERRFEREPAGGCSRVAGTVMRPDPVVNTLDQEATTRNRRQPFSSEAVCRPGDGANRRVVAGW